MKFCWINCRTLAFHPFTSLGFTRHQVIRINNELSDPLPVESGVPQGSILRPILLSIYVNDLSSVFRHCLSESYVSVINGDFLRILNWCFDNRLLLNRQKRHSSCYTEVAKYSLTSLTSVCRFWGKILYPQKPLKILALHLIWTSQFRITALKLFRPVCPALLKSVVLSICLIKIL